MPPGYRLWQPPSAIPESQLSRNYALAGTSFTDPNFMRIRTLARAPRTVQLGARFVF